MNHYSFPKIENISDCLSAIGDSDEFIIKKDESSGLYIINYLFSSPTTFPDPLSFENEIDSKNAAIRRECRGIEFDLESGNIVTRKYHKFFCVNQIEETQINKINWNDNHVILEKMDGSMVSPFRRKDGKLEWHTKMGMTDVAIQVMKFISENKKYEKFANFCIDNGWTVLFEWCSRKQRIVIDYPEDKLILIAIRDNITGQYIPY